MIMIMTVRLRVGGRMRMRMIVALSMLLRRTRSLRNRWHGGRQAAVRSMVMLEGVVMALVFRMAMAI